MVSKPLLPDGYELPASINGWHHDPKSNKNGHAWYSADGETAVAVFSGFGLGRGQRVYEHEYEDETSGRERKRLERQAVGVGIDAAHEWMDGWLKSAPARRVHTCMFTSGTGPGQ